MNDCKFFFYPDKYSNLFVQNSHNNRSYVAKKQIYNMHSAESEDFTEDTMSEDLFLNKISYFIFSCLEQL